MKHKDISEISVSQSTLSIEDAKLYLRNLHSGALGAGFVRYDNSNCADITSLANAFINNHSLIDFNIANYYTSDPLHVFRIDDWWWDKVEGLIYSNGVVTLYHKIGQEHTETKIIVWIKPETISLFNYPLPTHNE